MTTATQLTIWEFITAKTSQSLESEQDSKGTEVVSLEKYLGCCGKRGKKIDLNGLSMRTLKECLAQTEDSIISTYSLRWIGGGYDIEWELFNSKDYGVPQNRERVYTVGHLRRFGSRKIFPICGPDAENSIQVEQIGKDGTSKRENPNQNRVYSGGGLSPSLNCMEGGGREPHIPVSISRNGIGGGRTNAQTLMSRDYKGIGNQEMTAVLELINQSKDNQENMQTLLPQEKTEVLVIKDKQELL